MSRLVHLLVLDAAPQPFHEDVVHAPAPAVHAHLNALRLSMDQMQSTTKTEVLVGGGLGCNERGRSHLLTDLVRQTNELAPNGLMTGPSLDR